MKEEWRDVKDYEGYYQVSNLGNVRSLERIICDGTVRPANLRKLCNDGLGYKHVCLNKDGTNKTIKVHRLVATAFIPNPESKPFLDHINTIRDDNRVENLRWVTPKENYHNSKSKAKIQYNRNMFSFLGKVKKGAKSVLEYDLQGNFIREWVCVRYIMENTNLKSNRGIYSCAYGDKKHYQDKVYRWKEGDNIQKKIETGLSDMEIKAIIEKWRNKTPECTDGSMF